MTPSLLYTDQTLCFDEFGLEIPCAGTGQDAEFKKITGSRESACSLVSSTGQPDRISALIQRSREINTFDATDRIQHIIWHRNTVGYGVYGWTHLSDFGADFDYSRR
jgi:hypothetical protein